MQQQIVIDVTPGRYVPPEVAEEAKELEREVYFGALVAKSFLTESEMAEYENLIQQFVTEDDEPVDNIFSEKQQRLLTGLLYSSWKPLAANGAPRSFFATANVGLYTRLNPAIAPVAPDVLVSLDVTTPENAEAKQHRSYMAWEFGKLPEIVIEIVSNESGAELGAKLLKYARIGVRYYAVFDPDAYISEDILQVFELTPAGYRPRPDFALPETGLRLALWPGEFEGWQLTWLRWLDADGNMLLTAEKNAATERRAAQADERAAQLAEKLRALGVDPDAL